eukprot:TRINITY_DN4205_c0_g1_i2.p1 TRINITY_DN4205_c0_g1~~TRINITY_DN4205_c0_g1_i2.p1  ORF type:complete len:204 (+),score=14.04 TRINITY_DN4205_c0_g1_i2:170-781(+)
MRMINERFDKQEDVLPQLETLHSLIKENTLTGLSTKQSTIARALAVDAFAEVRDEKDIQARLLKQLRKNHPMYKEPEHVDVVSRILSKASRDFSNLKWQAKRDLKADLTKCLRATNANLPANAQTSTIVLNPELRRGLVKNLRKDSEEGTQADIDFVELAYAEWVSESREETEESPRKRKRGWTRQVLVTLVGDADENAQNSG